MDGGKNGYEGLESVCPNVGKTGGKTRPGSAKESANKNNKRDGSGLV